MMGSGSFGSRAGLIASALVGGVLLTACAGTATPLTQYLPRLGADPALISQVPPGELAQLKLVASNLVLIIAQLPDRQPLTTTVQVSAPATAFGSAVLRALEDAGYGMQRVSSDQGRHYVSYSKRQADTDAGPITDYHLAVGSVAVSREFTTVENVIVPSSLASVSGSPIDEVVLDDTPFREQGQINRTFVSGVRSLDAGGSLGEVGEIQVRDDDTVPDDRRTSQREILRNAGQRQLDSRGPLINPDLSRHERLRRTILIFDDGQSQMMGSGNKRAIRLMVRDVLIDDVFQITACTDADGQNESAGALGRRVGEEFLTHGVTTGQIYLAPCLRASFRHPSDNSPVPVEIVQLRLP